MQAESCYEWLDDRRLFGADPVLIVDVLDELPTRAQLPREFGEELVLFVRSRKVRIGSRLTVVVAQILVTHEEPQPIPNCRTTEIRRQVAIPGALISACQLIGARNSESHRLTGQAGRLRVVGGVIQEPLASL